jgi:hypothetical protein
MRQDGFGGSALIKVVFTFNSCAAGRIPNDLDGFVAVREIISGPASSSSGIVRLECNGDDWD